MNDKSGLMARRGRVGRFVREIENWEWEFVDHCPVCGDLKRTVVATRDRYGFRLRLAICSVCGIGYLMDRLKKEQYSRFYYEGLYRELIANFRGVSLDHYTMSGALDAEKYAEELVHLLCKLAPLEKGSNVLDIGGSTGEVAAQLINQYGCDVTVVDPSDNELEKARSVGAKTICGQIESVTLPDKRYDLVLICRTLDHLFDINGVMERLRGLLGPDGVVFVDYMDISEFARFEGCPEISTRLDHCFYFYSEMAPYFYSRYGLEILCSFNSVSMGCVGYLLRAGKSEQKQIPESILNPLVRKFLEMDTKWQLMPVLEQKSLSTKVRDRLTMVVQRMTKC